jgi:hypothetical protein
MVGTDWEVDFSQLAPPPGENSAEGRWYRRITGVILVLCSLAYFLFAMRALSGYLHDLDDGYHVLLTAAALFVSGVSFVGGYEAWSLTGYRLQTLAILALWLINAFFWILLLVLGLILLGTLVYFHGSGMNLRANLSWLYSILGFTGLLLSLFWHQFLVVYVP